MPAIGAAIPIPFRQGGNRPVFDIPLSSSLTQGINSLTSFTRGSVASVTDFEGLVKDTIISEARFPGARRVENLIRLNGTTTSTKISTNTGWSTLSFPGVTFTEDVADPGGGTTAIRVATGTTVLNANAGVFAAYAGVRPLGSRNSIYVRLVQEDPVVPAVVSIYDGNAAGLTVVNATSEWQRFTAPVSTAAAGRLGAVVKAGAASTVEAIVEIAFPQLEDVRDQANTSPSEFVSVGVGTGPELQPNGDFSVDDTSINGTIGEWTWQAAATPYWEITGGQARQLSGAAQPISGKAVAAVGKLYQVSYTLSGTSTPIGVLFGGSTLDAYGAPLPFVNGSHTATCRAAAPNGFSVLGTISGFDVQLDNVSVKEIDFGSNVDGVKYFDTVNPNIVTSNIVTARTPPVSANTGIITTPDMSADDGQWSWLSSNWQITGGKLDCVVASTSVTEVSTYAVENNTWYRLQYTVENANASVIRIGGNVWQDSAGDPEVAVGVHDFLIYNTGGTSKFQVTGDAAGLVALDDVQITPLSSIPDDTLKGVLIEEASTNNLLHSEDFSNAVWIKNQVNQTPNDVAPCIQGGSGTLISDTTLSQLRYVQQTITKTAAVQTWTLSVYFRPKDYDALYLRVGDGGLNYFYADWATGIANAPAINTSGVGFTVINAQAIPIKDGWYRAEVTGTTDAAATLIARAYVNGPAAYVGVPGQGANIDGMQLEQLAFATSYMQTVASTVTRLDEELIYDVTGLQQAHSSSMEIHHRVDTNLSGYGPSFATAEGGGYSALYANSLVFGPTIGRVAGGSWLESLSHVNAEVSSKYAYRASLLGADCKSYQDGIAGTTIVPGNVTIGAVPTTLYIGANAANTNHGNSSYKNIKYFNAELADADLIGLTT